MDDRMKLINNIKTGGSMAIYVGTASIIKPIIQEHNKNRNAVTKICSVVSGTVISCGISNIASKWFGKMVDKVTNFYDDVKGNKVRKDDVNG